MLPRKPPFGMIILLGAALVGCYPSPFDDLDKTTMHRLEIDLRPLQKNKYPFPRYGGMGVWE